MHPYYIGCETTPIASSGLAYCFSGDQDVGFVIYTEQQIQDLYSTPASVALTPDEAWLFAGVIFATSMLAWGFRLALKQYNLGV